MAKLSASKAWEDTTRFLRAHGGLVFAVALALLALPSIIAAPWLTPLQERMTAGTLRSEELLGYAPVFLVILLVSLIGTLAIYTLALRPAVSVGEALRHGVGRLLPALGVTILIGLIFGVLAALLSIPLALGAAASGTAAPGASALLLLLLVPVAIYLFARVYLAQVAVVDGRGPISALKTSWALTRGNVGRLIVLLLVVFIVAGVVYLAGTFIFAGLLAVLGNALGGPSLGQFLAAIVTNILSAILTAVIVVLVAMVYRQLAGEAAGA